MFRVIFHLDMDAYYASVEQRDHPELRGKPLIVGAPPTQRGVVCAASYEARKFGVRSAMPSATAARLCPRGIFVRPRVDHYQEESRRIMKIVAESGAVVEQMSIDEAYLDASTLCPAEEAARSLWITPKIRTPEIANALLSATRDVDASVRVTSILSLQSFLRQEGLDKIIVPAAIPCLQDTNSEVRKWTIQLLAKYGAAPGVRTALSNLLNDPVPEVRNAAEGVIQKTHSDAGKN